MLVFISVFCGGLISGLWPSEESLRQEILHKHLNPEDFRLDVHYSSIVDSDGEKDLNITVSKVLARQNSSNSHYNTP
jgi:hypothetical protein